MGRLSYNRQVLPNGMVVLTERMPAVKSAAIGMWVRVGSRDEAGEVAGISHFIEHMLFKGTRRRSAQDIAMAIDAVGGTLDAFTSRETTCFYAKVLGEHLPLAIDILADTFLHSNLDPKDIERERDVVLQEIKMVEDTPDDLVHDLFAEAIWSDHPVARPILGRKETVRAFTQDDVRSHMDRFYRPNRTVVVAAGDLEHERLVDLVAQAFNGFEGRSVYADLPPPSCTATVRVEERDTAQLHMCLGMDGLPHAHKDRYALYLLNAMLGGSMSSRLFQEIREKRGLAYSIYSYQASYRDCGLLVVYAGTNPDSSGQVVDLIRTECARLRNQPIDPGDLQRAKDQLKGSLLLGLEGTSSRMTRLAKTEIYFEGTYSLDDIIAGIDSVSSDQFESLTRRILRDEAFAITTIGPVAQAALLS
ncbi:peptidase M16 [Candidatus Methylomirabilis lanthanidiphila]|uniref:Peptidase M16 n=1 Tax=Candidatus Methylomirabilis lanthanidiphila TaxID=2211376 RepID=A0A564ZII0_9BACT|nr:insulinase family protein [Candidatus Methylomirabilis lanthanidiphila]VUZ84442.1 peptidase M16 [Candidatus Methylomirabilis lanthanidiphila]